MHMWNAIEYGLAGLALASGLAGCAGTSGARAMCEGLQARVRVVDPLADPKLSRDHPSCLEYEAERKRLQEQPAK